MPAGLSSAHDSTTSASSELISLVAHPTPRYENLCEFLVFVYCFSVFSLNEYYNHVPFSTTFSTTLRKLALELRRLVGCDRHLGLYPIVTSHVRITAQPLYTRFHTICSSCFSKVTIGFIPIATPTWPTTWAMCIANSAVTAIWPFLSMVGG